MTTENEQRTYLPKEWNDEKTITFRFAEFRAKSANPEGWEIKMRFWFSCVEKWSFETKTYAFCVEDVRNAFLKDSKRPDINCLKLVMSNMLREKLIIPFHEFVASCEKQARNEGWLSWGMTSLSKPLSFLSLLSAGDSSDLTETIDPQVDEETRFVNVNAVRGGGKLLLNEFVAKNEDINCFHYDVIERIAKEKFSISSENFKLVILHLKAEKKVTVLEENGLKLVKFGSDAIISDVEVSLMRLEKAKSLIESEISKCEKDMEACREEARQCVRESNRSKAKSLLKRKKRLENLIQKKETQLDNVLFLLEQLSNTDSHKMVYNAYQKCVEALKQAQISTETLDNTLLDVEDVLEKQAMITQFGRMFESTSAEEAEDIENELELLLTEDNENNAKTDDDEELKCLMKRLESLRKPDEDSPSKVASAKKPATAAV